MKNRAFYFIRLWLLPLLLFAGTQYVNAQCVTPTITSAPAQGDTVVTYIDQNHCQKSYTFNFYASGTQYISFKITMSGATSGTVTSSGIFTSFQFNIGVTTLKLEATNSCGTDVRTFYVNVVDNNAPTIYGPNSITLNRNNGCTVNSTSVLSYFTAVDNCGYTSTSISPSVINIGTASFTVTSVDPQGNVGTKNVSISLLSPEINVLNGSNSIADNDMTPSTADGTDWGTLQPFTVYTKIYTVKNTGTDTLSVGTVSLTNPTNGGGFSINGSAFPKKLAPGESGGIGIKFLTSNSSGNPTVDIVIQNNDCDESTYNFRLAANVVCPTVSLTVPTDTVYRSTNSGECKANYNVSTNVNAGSALLIDYYQYVLSGATNASFNSLYNFNGYFNIGVTKVQVRAYNICGSYAEKTFYVKVSDNIAPYIYLSAATLNVGSGCTAATNGLKTDYIHDACGVASVTNDAPATLALGTWTVKWTATDVHGNTSTANQTVTVVDNIKPTITAPGNLIENTDNSSCSATNISLGTPTTADNCSVDSVWNDAPSSFPKGSTTVTWTVRDASGNTDTATQTVTVIDKQRPNISGPSSITLSMSSGCTMSSSSLLNYYNYSDNCGVISYKYVSPSQLSIGTNYCLIRARDVSGNERQYPVTVTVTAPEIQVQYGNTVIADGDLTISSTDGTDWGSLYPHTVYYKTYTVKNTSSIPLDVSSISLSTVSGGGGFSIYTNPFPATIPGGQSKDFVVRFLSTNTSISGNTTADIKINNADCDEAEYNFRIGAYQICPSITLITPTGTVNRNTDAGTCHSNYSFSVSGGSSSPVRSFKYELTGATTAIINYNTTSPSQTFNYNYNVGTTNVRVYAYNRCNNSTYKDFTVVVTNNQTPVVTAPADITVNADNGVCWATVTNFGTPATSGICYVDTIWSDAMTSYQVGPSTVTWTVKDNNGNTYTATQNIVVTDNQPPTITAPAAVTVNADNGNCSATNVALGMPTTADNCGVDSVWNDATSLPVGTNTVTWTVKDIHGNTATATQTVTVIDNQNPDITAPIDVTTNADFGQCYATNVALDVPTTGDNCGILSETNNAPSSFPVGTTTVTWTVTDIHGNTNTATQTVTVIDNQNPTITSPASVTVNTDSGICGATNVTLGTPITADNCGVDSVWNNAPALFPVGNTTVTWTVKDIHGNTSIATNTVTVIDNENPVIVCPADVTVNADSGQCAATNISLGVPVTSDNCGVDSIWDNAPSSYAVGTTTVTWMVTDIHGNSATCTQNVTVIDNQNPAITAPSALTINADNGLCAATGVNLGTAITSDNCGVDSVWNNAPSSYPVGTTTVTWSVIDIHGNISTATQTVTVVDNQAPVAVCKNYTVTLSGGTTTINPSDVDNGSTDNCGIATMSLSKSTFTCADAGDNQVVLTVYDIHGNSASCTATVTVPAAPTVSVTTTPSNNTYTGGNPNNIYLGYGPQSATITAAGTGGGSFSYSWSPSAGLSCNNCQAPVFTPTAAGNYTYTVTATNEGGCSATSTVSFCVQDVQEYKNNGNLSGKIYVCIPKNNGSFQTKAVQSFHVAGHLQSGATLGKCGEGCGASAKGGKNTIAENSNDEIEIEDLVVEKEIKVYPNPNRGTFKVTLPNNTWTGNIIIRNMLGKEIKRIPANSVTELTVNIPEVADGMYMVELVNTIERQSTRILIKR